MIIRKTESQLTTMTADELFAMPQDDARYELINGVLHTMSPAGSEHGRFAGRIYMRLAVHVDEHDLGETYAAETGFKITFDPDTVRAPDAAFVSHERLAKVESTRAFLPLAPDLLVEVVSPGDSFTEVEAKTNAWLKAGASIVIVADPKNQTLHVYQSANESRIYRAGETFESGDVCGNLQLSVNDIFRIDMQPKK